MQGEYDWVLVALSYGVSVLGAVTALQLAIDIPLARGPGRRLAAVLASALAMGGGGIWAMHFIAMLACRMPMPVAYDIGLTLLSALIAVAACALGLAWAGLGEFRQRRVVPAGLFMGLGVAGMHYTGMAAMLMPATIHYDPWLVAASVVIAVVASMAALWTAFTLRGGWRMVGAAVIMGVAVCGMHYTGMAAAGYTPRETVPAAGSLGTLGGDRLGVTTFLVTAFLLSATLMVSHVRFLRRQAASL